MRVLERGGITGQHTRFRCLLSRLCPTSCQPVLVLELDIQIFHSSVNLSQSNCIVTIIMVEPIFDYQFRIIIIGNSTVGKSSLLKYFTDGRFAEVHTPDNVYLLKCVQLHCWSSRSTTIF